MPRNLTDALTSSLKLLLSEGYEVPSRNGATKELYSHQVKIEKPAERVIMTPARGVNIFAQLAEAMWVMAGRDDMEFLSRYLPRAKDYSDDGEVWRAAYGTRLRAWPLRAQAARTQCCYRDHDHDGNCDIHAAPGVFRHLVPDEGEIHSQTNPSTVAVDQIDECLKILCESLDSRRAVMVIFDPARDYCQSKDIPCLAGETILWSPEGDLPISEVARKFEEGEVSRWPVYAVDPKTKTLSIQWATKVWLSGEKETIRLGFDDGSSLRLTPDHRLFWKGRVKKEGAHPKATFTEVRECEAGSLEVGDRVWATQRFYNPKGYELHKKVLTQNTAWANLRATAREYSELLHGPITSGWDVHHVNEVKTDNRAENLETHEHGYHSSFNMHGDDNPMRRLTPEQHAQRAAKQASSLSQNRARWSPGKRAEVSRKQSAAASRRPRNADGTWASKASPGNHKIVSIEEGGVAPVYDFQVPEGHTALVGTGVVAHNCNNWLHFLVRDGKLNLTVAVRSNDAIWGFSGINMFEWSVLQQMMAHWLEVGIGTLAYTASSFHLYDYHWDKAANIVTYAKSKTMYDFGIRPLAFATGWEDFGPTMDHFFKGAEALHALDVEAYEAVLAELEDPFLGGTLRMLAVWHQYQAEPDNVRAIAHLVNEIPESDLRMGAIDFFRRQKKTREAGFMDYVSLSEREQEFLDWYKKKASVDVTIPEIFWTLKVLHWKKTQSYGDSWKKHGETLGLFSNITRKRDRILALQGGAQGTADEGIFDTISDLCVYAGKYLTLIAELYPTEFADFLKDANAQVIWPTDLDEYAHTMGFDPVLDMLAERAGKDERIGKVDWDTLDECLLQVKNEYKKLEDMLTDVYRPFPEGAIRRPGHGKTVTEAAARMCLLCAQALRVLSRQSPGTWDKYVDIVEGL